MRNSKGNGIFQASFIAREDILNPNLHIGTQYMTAVNSFLFTNCVTDI